MFESLLLLSSAAVPLPPPRRLASFGISIEKLAAFKIENRVEED